MIIIFNSLIKYDDKSIWLIEIIIYFCFKKINIEKNRFYLDLQSKKD